MKKRSLFSVLLLSTALLLSGGCGSSQYYPAKTIPFTRNDPGIVKAMTFNIRTKTFIDGFNGWNRRKDIVFDILADNAPDVFGLQEARYTQYRAVRQALPQYGSYAAGRSNGKASGESCPIFYRRDRFTLADAGTFWFSDTPSVPGSKDWGNRPPRICSWARLVERQTGIGFYVYNLHLDHRSQNSREKSVRLLTTKIKVRKTKDPFIVMGDFNMRPDNSAMRYLDRIGQQNTVVKSFDIWQMIHPGRTLGTRHGFRGSLRGPQIDYIRISSNLQALDVRIDHRHNENGRYPSDHFPLIAKILLAPASGRGYTSAARENTNTSKNPKQLPGV